MTDSPTAPPPESSVDAAAPTESPVTAASPTGTNRGLLFNVVIPLVILVAGIASVILFGKQEAEERADTDQTLVGRMKQLEGADVMKVRALSDVGGKLDLEVDGTVVPYREVQIATQVAGMIIEKTPQCEAGTFVTKGQLLCRIDPEDYELQVEQFSRARDREYQALKELDQELANAKRLLEVTDDELAIREKELKRLESIPASFASETELDTARRARLQATQAKISAENQLALLEKRRSRLEAAERLAASQLRAAELDLERTEIRAPVDGVIISEDAELNSFVQRGSSIITIEDTSRVEVVVNLRGDQLHWVLDQAAGENPATILDAKTPQGYSLPKTPVTIRYEVAGRKGELYQWDGQLVRYDGIGLDPQTRTAPVRIVVDDPRRFKTSDGRSAEVKGPSALVRGMFVSVIMHIQPRSDLVLIPSLAMQPGGRVWHFQPNPAVLEPDDAAPQSDVPAEGFESINPVVAEAEPDDAPEEAEPGEAVMDDAEREAYMKAWVAGQVQVVEDVRAIESTMLPPGPATTAPLKYWICEVPSGDLQAGQMVVVSPLQAVAIDKPLAVRVPRSQTNGVPPAAAITAQR